MEEQSHLNVQRDIPPIKIVISELMGVLSSRAQPSPWELIKTLCDRLGPKARWVATDALRQIIDTGKPTRAIRDYLINILESEDWDLALQSTEGPSRQIESTIDALFRESKAYKQSSTFQEMISFMANFRDYAPFNNMLVKIQKPSCSFFATRNDWKKRFGRDVKEDANPLLILAPMHPVMLVYELDSTEGPPLPEEIQQFAKFEGNWKSQRLGQLIENVKVHDLIRVYLLTLSSTNAGFATIDSGTDGMKMRIGLHDGLDEPSRFGVLLHELAHIYLGHLGGDKDGWWPCRGNLSRGAMEIEAEAVAFIVSRRSGLKGTSSAYVSSYIDSEETLRKVSPDMIAKASGRLTEMCDRSFGKRPPRKSKAK